MKIFQIINDSILNINQRINLDSSILPSNHPNPSKTNSISPPILFARIFSFFIILTLLTTLSIPSADAWCVLGLGTTCSNGGNGLNQFIGNIWNGITSVFSSKPADNTIIPTSQIVGPNNQPGDINTHQYDGGTIQERVATIGQPQEVTTSDALWYDLDILGSRVECVGCIHDYNEPGHTLVLYYLIKNYGNINNNQKFNLQGKIITPSKTLILDYKGINAYISGGSSVEFIEPIPKFGISSNGSLEPWAIGNGYIDIQLELSISNDNNVVQIGRTTVATPIQKSFYDTAKYKACYAKIKCPCTGTDCTSFCKDYYSTESKKCEKLTTTYYTVYEYKEVFSCPDNTETNQLATSPVCKIETLGVENKNANIIKSSFKIKQLSPQLSGSTNIQI